MPHPFPKTRRLLTPRAFSFVFQQAKKASSDGFVILFRRNPLGDTRLGFAVAKKKVAKAHDRNRIKRVFRESFRLQADLPPVDIVVTARHGAHKLDHQALHAQTLALWKKCRDRA
ncbi:MAG: ribonuclease P protein component [marine bacterium B5-7]|nr:MAG: ribonuclease P protein component [marine bacterium B5-7]